MRASGDVAPAVRAVVAVAATSIFMVLVAWATLIGPDQVFPGPGPRPGTGAPSTASCIPLPVVTDADGTTTVEVPEDVDERDYCAPPPEGIDDFRERGEDASAPLWVTVLAWILLVGMLAALGALVVWLLVALVRHVRPRSREDDVRTAVEFDVLGEAARVTEAITVDADEQDALLRAGEPRNAIVAAWHRFEVQGERAGVARLPSETSSEFALRVLDLVAAESAPVNTLAALYREARFSDHPMTEDHRDRALAALAAIRRSLAVRA